MPNIFAGFPIYDPRFEREHRSRFRREEISHLAKANSLYISNDKWPARGWFLMRRADYDKVNLFSTSLSLQIDDYLPQAPPVTFNNLAIVQAKCVSRGIAADPNAIYLVEITDRKGVLWNQWSQFGTTSYYNSRSPAYPGQFYVPSLNAGLPWTWNALVSDLWRQMPLLGPYPALPITPIETAEGWDFPGTSAWESLISVLDYLGCTVATNLTQATPYTIVSGGAADPAFVALQAKYANLLEDDYEIISTGSGRVPGSVVVYFHRRNQFYGTEETVRRDTFQWATAPLYSVTVTATQAGYPAFAASAGVHYLWAEFTVQYDIDGLPLAADVTTANAVAIERSSQYYNRIYSGTAGSMRQVYTGALPFATGSLVDGVCWRQSFPAEGNNPPPPYRAKRDDYRRAGWITEITRGDMPPWPEVFFHVE